MSDQNINADEKKTISKDALEAIQKEIFGVVARYLVGLVVGITTLAGFGLLLYLKSVIPIISGGVPSGAVMAFALEDGCPTGWTPYTNAAGRTIIGAGQNEGLTRRQYLSQGGAEDHKLSVSEMPPHSLNINGKGAGYSAAGDRYNAGGKDYVVVGVDQNVLKTESIGSGTPFSTMPPFVVLHYCKKTS